MVQLQMDCPTYAFGKHLRRLTMHRTDIVINIISCFIRIKPLGNSSDVHTFVHMVTCDVLCQDAAILWQPGVARWSPGKDLLDSVESLKGLIRTALPSLVLPTFALKRLAKINV